MVTLVEENISQNKQWKVTYYMYLETFLCPTLGATIFKKKSLQTVTFAYFAKAPGDYDEEVREFVVRRLCVLVIRFIICN